MKVIVLSRSSALYSTQSLLKAGKKRGHEVVVMDHMRMDVAVGDGQSDLFYRRGRVKGIHAIIPRIGASATSYGALIIRHFIHHGVYSVLSAESLLQARNKFSCLQILAHHGLPIPKTIISAAGLSGKDIYDVLGGPPYIIKLLESTHGNGVLKANSVPNAAALLGQFLQANKQIIIQEYIKESKGEDIRVLVVGGKVVAAMRRVASAGEFRSNLHRGGVGFKVELTEREVEVSLQAAKVMGLQVAGVDILRSKRGPLLLEVNASPGLEGIEGVTRVDVADKIFEFLEREIK